MLDFLQKRLHPIKVVLKTEKTLFGNWYTVYTSVGPYEAILEFEDNQAVETVNKIKRMYGQVLPRSL